MFRELGGVRFSLSFLDDVPSSLTIICKFLRLLGRLKSPTRLVVDFVFFGLWNEDCSFCLPSFAILSSIVAAALGEKLLVVLVGDRERDLDSSYCLLGEREPEGSTRGF